LVIQSKYLRLEKKPWENALFIVKAHTFNPSYNPNRNVLNGLGHSGVRRQLLNEMGTSGLSNLSIYVEMFHASSKGFHSLSQVTKVKE
jgi:hypothetical protein